MQQKVLLECKIYLFCIYFYLNNFNYPNKKLAIPSNQRNSSPKVLRNSRKSFAEENKTCLGFEVCICDSMIYYFKIIFCWALKKYGFIFYVFVSPYIFPLMERSPISWGQTPISGSDPYLDSADVSAISWIENISQATAVDIGGYPPCGYRFFHSRFMEKSVSWARITATTIRQSAKVLNCDNVAIGNVIYLWPGRG